MAKKKEEKPKVEEEKPKVEEEKPKVEEEKPKVEKEEPKVEKKKSKDKEIDGRKIGRTTIGSTNPKEINGRNYTEIHTIDGLTFILNKEDFNLQVSK